MIDLKSDNGSLKEIISIFVSPLIMVIVNAVNCTTKREHTIRKLSKYTDDSKKAILQLLMR